MNSKFDLYVYPSINEVCDGAVDIFSDLISLNGNKTFIVPGGKTPYLFYKILSNRVNNWRGLKLLFLHGL